LGDPGLDERLILSLVFSKVECGGMNWNELAQDMDRRLALVTTVMNNGFLKMRGISLIVANRLATHEGLCSME